jgi:pimeloyl-ACP methyl ester carboxylesterase
MGGYLCHGYTDTLLMTWSRRRRSIGCAIAVLVAGWMMGAAARAQGTATLKVRGRDQTLHLYGARGGDPIVVSSGDGGWVHLAPHIAVFLASKGFFVVGFDVKAYLASFTSGKLTLRREDEPADYRALAEFAAKGAKRKPILLGVSAGAGLSVLAATDPQVKTALGGVIAVGLPERTELGWQWKDSLIYLTHGVPNEPTFTAESVVGSVAPLPLAAIHSTHDEFFSVADLQKALQMARPPSKLWIVPASDHRFSDNAVEFDRRLLEAIEWMKHNSPP